MISVRPLLSTALCAVACRHIDPQGVGRVADVVAMLPPVETSSVILHCDVILAPGGGLQARVTLTNRSARSVFVSDPSAYAEIAWDAEHGYVAVHGPQRLLTDVGSTPNPDPVTRIELLPGASSTQAAWMWQAPEATPSPAAAFRCKGQWWDGAAEGAPETELTSGELFLCRQSAASERIVICPAPLR